MQTKPAQGARPHTLSQRRDAPPFAAPGTAGPPSVSSLRRTTFCFVTAHLAAHQGEKGQLQERNRDCVRILQNLLGDGRDACASFDHLFFFGDLNYRLGPAELPDKVKPPIVKPPIETTD